jgi:PAS domain S-box-containing protein
MSNPKSGAAALRIPRRLLAFMLAPIVVLSLTLASTRTRDETLWLLLGLVTLSLLVTVRWASRVLEATLSDLEHSRETYSSIVENQTALVCRYRPSDYTLTFVNVAYARRFGRTREELLGTSFLSLVPEEDHPAVRDFVAAMGPSSKPPATDHRTINADGAPSWIRWVDRPVKVEDGRVVEVQAVGYDVSELRQLLDEIALERDRRQALNDALEARVRERTADLAEANAALRRSETLSAVGALVAGVAHEVRNPLFAMSASLDAFDEEFRNNPQFAEYSVHFRREMSRLEALMRQLLDYARPEQVELAEQPLIDVVRSSVVSCQALAEKLGVSLRVDGANDACAAVAAARLQQALQNLIENAIQHAPAGSEINVGILGSPDGAEWWITIGDRGPGFSPADLPRAFEPFFTRRRGGTGLGLSIAQRILEQQHGRIELHNRSDGGAEARLILPVGNAQAGLQHTPDP